MRVGSILPSASAPSASLLLALAVGEAAAPLSPGPRLLSAPRNASTTFLRFMPSILRMALPERMPARAGPPIDPVHGGLYHQEQLISYKNTLASKFVDKEHGFLGRRSWEDSIMKNSVKPFLIAFALLGAVAPAHAAEKVDFILNWVAGGDHAPYYYAQKMGWYAQAAVDVNLIQGSGSSNAAQRAGAGVDQFGLADMTTVMVAIGKGADEVAVMNVYANYPGGFYWLKSSGIKSVKDLAGKKIGNPPGDAARALWPALAKANGIDPNSVTWVNLTPNAKLPALKAGSVDAVTEFFNLHHGYKRELGDNMGYLAWKDAGLDPYGNSIVVNGAYLKAHRATVASFVKITQKAFAACVADAKPCIDALVEANSGLKPDDQMVNWQEVEELMSDKTSQTIALGWFDPKRMENDYNLVKAYVGIEKPFDMTKYYTNAFLDKSIKMVPAKSMD
jgi:NitT/TauT family transport system substrate-binding protein